MMVPMRWPLLLDCQVEGEKPEFKDVLEQEDVSAKTGQKRMTLTFQTTGGPEPRVHFYHNDLLLNFDERVRSGELSPCGFRRRFCMRFSKTGGAASMTQV